MLFSRANLEAKIGRTFQVSRSPDLIHWGPQMPIRTAWAGGSLGLYEQLYTINAQPLPGAEHIYVATPTRCGHTWMTDEEAATLRGAPPVDGDSDAEPTREFARTTCDTIFMTSRDGRLCNRVLSGPAPRPL